MTRRQLAGTPHEPHLRLLETFAYGTYADAQAKADQLPKLTDSQVPLYSPKERAKNRPTLFQIQETENHVAGASSLPACFSSNKPRSLFFGAASHLLMN